MTIEREVGALQARMEALEQEVHAVRADVREIRDGYWIPVHSCRLGCGW